ncbi:unnamed protein product [Malus baccata var. baccata]
MAADNRIIKELSASGLDNPASICIQYPMATLGKTDEFELKSSLLHHILKFHGMFMEDEFKVVCSSMTLVNVDGSIFKMKTFPFSLLDNVKDWLYELAPGTVTAWRLYAAPSTTRRLYAATSGLLYQAIRTNTSPTTTCPKHLRARKSSQSNAKPRQKSGPNREANWADCGVCRRIQRVSSTVINLNGGFEYAKAISLRSGKQVGSDPQSSKLRSNEVEELIIEEDEQSTHTSRVETPLPQAPNAPKPSNSANKGKEVQILINSNVVPPNVPFPRRFMQSKQEETENDILETFKKVQVNIPLLDAIKQVPRYAKFLKELCTTRKRISSKEVVKVSENVSAVLQRKLPTKYKDPGSFTISCVIGNTRFEFAMLDICASINVMPYSIYASMHLGELKNDGVIIQLADRSNVYPKGVLEDILVHVNHLIFSADFYVLEMDESDHSFTLPILLGRPFLKTARTKIDVFNETLTMEFGGEVINFNLSDSIKYHCQAI